MRTRDLDELLHQIHHSIDRVAQDLERDRPDLARALRRESTRIPRPSLLYQALDAGALDARRFDVLMLQRVRADRALRTAAR